MPELQPHYSAPTSDAHEKANSTADISSHRAKPNWGDMIRDHEAKKVRRQNRNRQRDHRAKVKRRKAEPDKARLDALLHATARPSGDNSLRQLRTREQDLVRFRNTMGLAAFRHGAKASMQQVADLHALVSGEPFTRDQARRWRDTVEKLEAPGGPWHDL